MSSTAKTNRLTIVFPGEDLVPKSAHEVAKQQGARAAGNRRFARTNVTEQEQSQSGSERRRWGPAEAGLERRESSHESSEA